MTPSNVKWWLLLANVFVAANAFECDSAINELTGAKVTNLEDVLKKVSTQLMMQQFYVEEEARSNGDSGLKQIRMGRHGARPYLSASYADNSIASIHDHANNDRTVGMGEIIAVLNGIEFRTRHNDYRLRMKSRESPEYGAIEDIEFPTVPPEVKRHISVIDQINEMREWFKAWSYQDHSVRDYRRYFKPILCYLEGSWTHSDPNSIDEPFDSDRHHFDADSWYDLQQKVRFTSYSGGKDGSENLGYLPTTIMKLINGTIPVLAQWNYNILCHPLSKDLPLDRLHPVDDLKTRMSMGAVSMESYLFSRAARFKVHEPGQNPSINWDLLDELMAEIPGRDNYRGVIKDTLFDDVALQYNIKKNKPLNVAYYHRSYRVGNAGAMGLKNRHRGFSDGSVFVAQTTQPKVVSLSVDKCDPDNGRCKTWTQRWSYAIPLEIIYMTPLTKWNPYNIPYRGDARTQEGKQIYVGPKGKRNGNPDKDSAYNGTNSKVYYITPTTFFEDEFQTDPADTTKKSPSILGAGDEIRQVRASGHRIFLPNIPDVGVLRQRYPIMPIYGEGSAVWKELEALKDIVLEPSKYLRMFRDARSPSEVGTSGEEIDEGHGMEMKEFTTQEASAEWGAHTHHFTLTLDQFIALNKGSTIKNVITEVAQGHSHDLTLVGEGRKKYVIELCDGVPKCFDGHGRRVFLL